MRSSSYEEQKSPTTEKKSLHPSVAYLLEYIETMLIGVYEFAKLYKGNQPDTLSKIAWNFIEDVYLLIRDTPTIPYAGPGTQSCPLNPTLNVATLAVFHLSLMRNWALNWVKIFNDEKENFLTEFNQTKTPSLYYDQLKIYYQTKYSTLGIPCDPLPKIITNPKLKHSIKIISMWAENQSKKTAALDEQLETYVITYQEIRKMVRLQYLDAFDAEQVINLPLKNAIKSHLNLFKPKDKQAGFVEYSQTSRKLVL